MQGPAWALAVDEDWSAREPAAGAAPGTVIQAGLVEAWVEVEWASNQSSSAMNGIVMVPTDSSSTAFTISNSKFAVVASCGRSKYRKPIMLPSGRNTPSGKAFRSISAVGNCTRTHRG